MIASNIKVLDRNLANMIAAGEVVERPASVVKELVENSLDAGAGEITVEIKNGGKTYIRVTDDGIGMSMNNAKKAFLRHATSKIAKLEDLFNISTMGFRGEALAAIASVSRVEVETASVLDAYGTRLVIEAGDEIFCDEVGVAKGTTIIVKDLFFNTPARFNFLKKDSTETANIVSLIHRLAIGRPGVSFRLIVDGKTVLSTDKQSSPIDVIYSVLGREICDNLLEIYRCNAKIKVTGYVGRPRISRSNRNHQMVFVNGRYIKSKTITAAIDKAYHNLLMNGKHAVAILFIDVAPNKTDVNVHPTKMEIKFSDESFVFENVYHAIKDGLEKESQFVKNNDESVKPSGDMPAYVADFIRSLSPDTKQELKISEPKEFLSYETLNNISQTVSTDDIELPEEAMKFNFPIPDTTPTFSYSPSQNAKLMETGYYSRQTRLDYDELSVEYAPERYDESFLVTSEIQYRYVGELFKTYIIIESGALYYLVDKHAAHERILFNKIYQEFKYGEKYSQTLLQPISISLTPEEFDTAHRYKEDFERYGYAFTEFGETDVLLRTVPYVISPGDTVSSFIELIGILDETGELGVTHYENQTMKMLACKAAIKAGYESSSEELEYFIKDLIKKGNINYCPHGRPIICEYSKHDIEKDFKRKL